ncbi:MAG TPA: dihydropteroate synthase [Candidatus Limnocylindrales bacterium]|nr:dihydropteroate synthase [Candidatus Limnocylindrales bacterium]
MSTELRWGERTYVMGILNVTPDSFSGDGLATADRSPGEVVAAALAQARGFVDAGADMLDVGAESTRPRNAYGDRPDVGVEAELALAIPVVQALVGELAHRALVSIDTSKGAVARAALRAGARMVNDVWAGRRDPGTAEAAAEAGAHLVLMHNQDGVDYPDGVFETVVRWLGDAVTAAEARGVARERIIVDPGIGFGKGTEENLELLHRLGELKAALGGLPILLGTSRKRFLGELLDGAPAQDRIEGTAATVALGIAAGVDVVRVHDVAAIARTRRVADAIVRR